MTRKRRRYLLFLPVLILIGFGVWSSRVEVVAHGDRSAGFTIVQDESIGRRTLVDMNIPILGRVEWPSGYESVQGFDPKTMAGLLVYSGSRAVTEKSYWLIYDSAMDPESPDREVPVRELGRRRYVIPRTFRGHPINATLFVGDAFISVGLPSSDVPYPSLATKVVGDRVELKPGLAIVPGAPIRYRATLQKPGNAIMLVRGSERRAWTQIHLTYGYPADFWLSPGADVERDVIVEPLRRN